ncbi:FtsQ-type POTRA domain-containing protein [Hyphomicrobium sp.]|uniref:cell division protein FtsQ/DivIB n=1 Tax=Hyphomicrobium sp. TaxID=82 RepID=UPI001D746FA2|nr:FtsQ-type POTRA domain-containing protein [Hyphomicrobium sp.]MBY0559692.1 FtsQ-type POTRA domain-containing protein [Hyphomicrobium sp.]
MQQVESKQRFWWRAAHDAPTPEPDAARWTEQTSRTAEARSPATRGRSATNRTAKRSPLDLQIPRGERRFRGSRRNQRWMKPAPIAAAAVVAVCAGAFALSFDKLAAIDFAAKANDVMIAAGFGIDQVNVSGQHYASDSDVFDALDLPNVKTFAAFNSDAALKRIERIAWVDTAQITRVYPGTLDVVIRERTPAFMWQRGETNFLVDATGRTLGPAARANNWNLPRVVGEGADTEAILMLSALRQYPQIERQYAYGERIAERRWRIVLKNGTALELGADREIEGFQEVATAREASAALKGAPMVVDVRTPGRIAIRPLAGNSARTASNAGARTISLASERP